MLFVIVVDHTIYNFLCLVHVEFSVEIAVKKRILVHLFAKFLEVPIVFIAIAWGVWHVVEGLEPVWILVVTFLEEEHSLFEPGSIAVEK